VENPLCFLNSPIAISQTIQNVGFEEVFPLKMNDSGSPSRVCSSEVLQVLFGPDELDTPRRNRGVQTHWGSVSHCSSSKPNFTRPQTWVKLGQRTQGF